MAKKVFLTIVFAVIFILALTTITFAESSNSTTKLGNEVSSSMNKTERSMDDLVDRSDLDEAGQKMTNGVRDSGDVVKDGVEDVGRGIEDLGDEDNSNKNDDRAVAGTTGNFSAGQVQTDGEATNGMSQNAWIWIVMVVVALIIIAAVWYYATQK